MELENRTVEGIFERCAAVVESVDAGGSRHTRKVLDGAAALIREISKDSLTYNLENMIELALTVEEAAHVLSLVCEGAWLSPKYGTKARWKRTSESLMRKLDRKGR